MHPITILSTVLLASQYASARADHEDQDKSSTITSSASLACQTGEASSKYEACSSSISSKIDSCDDSDLGCACSHANSGFACLTSYCPAHTTAVCEASLALHNLCALVNAPGPTLTGVTCPSDVPDLLASLIPSDVRSLMPSDVRSYLPSGVNSKVPTDIPFFGGVQASTKTATVGETGSGSGSGTGNVGSMSVPSQTGGASSTGIWTGMGWEGDVLRFLLSVAIAFSLAVSVGCAIMRVDE